MCRDFYAHAGSGGEQEFGQNGFGETPFWPDPSLPVIDSEDAGVEGYNPGYHDLENTEIIGADDALAAEENTVAIRPVVSALGDISVPEPENVSIPAETSVPYISPGEHAETLAPRPTSIGETDIVTDPELADLLHTGLKAVGPTDLDKILRANAPFNRPVTVVHEDTTETYEPHFSNKNLLRELPSFTEAATAAGVPTDQATDLLTHALGSVRHPDIDHGTVPVQITRVFQAAADVGETMTTNELAGIKNLVTKAGQDDVIEMSLSAYEAARRAGVSHEDSLRMVNDHIDTANYRQLGYMMYHFRDALRALDSGGIDPTVTVDVFDQVRDMHPEYRGEAYDAVASAIVFGSATNEKTPHEMMQDVAEQLRTSSRQQAGGEITSGQLPDTIEGIVIAPREQRDTYFPEVPGRLENRALPYRTVRSFGDGMQDIERLTRHRSQRGEIISEGHWVHDPQSNTWYSHGGETRYAGPGRIRHTSIGYDVSELSTTPRSIHIHPNEFAVRSDKYGFAFPTNADYRAVAAMLENAQGPVQMRSFISHPLGITEFTYPSDPQAIRAVAERFEQLRDNFFDYFQSEDHLLTTANAIGSDTFVRTSIAEVQAALPPGFTLRYYLPGTDLDNV